MLHTVARNMTLAIPALQLSSLEIYKKRGFWALVPLLYCGISG